MTKDRHKQADLGFALTMRSSSLVGASKRSRPIVRAGTDALAAWGGMHPALQSKAIGLFSSFLRGWVCCELRQKCLFFSLPTGKGSFENKIGNVAIS